jgi:hypothetical protein
VRFLARDMHAPRHRGGVSFFVLVPVPPQREEGIDDTGVGPEYRRINRDRMFASVLLAPTDFPPLCVGVNKGQYCPEILFEPGRPFSRMIK